jgi:DNA polymerase-3 subunit chi
MLCFLETKAAEQRALLCQWVEFFYEAGNKTQVLADSSMAAQHLDQMLWTFSQPSFIPHRVLSGRDASNVQEPVVITVGELRLPDWDVLICDGSARLELMVFYPVAIHFIILDDQDRRGESRLLWQQGKDRGVELRHIAYASNLPGLGWPGGQQASDSLR